MPAPATSRLAGRAGDQGAGAAAAGQGEPRFRLVYRNEPIDGAPAVSVILAIGRRDRMIAYVKAARRVKEQAALEGRSG